MTADNLEVGGSVEAQRARVIHLAEVGGRVTTRDGMKAERIVLHRRSRASGPLVGGRIELAARTVVEDLYGSEVVMDSGAEARRVFAEVVTIGSGASAVEVTYTRSATIHPSARIGRPPLQVSQLDPFPL